MSDNWGKFGCGQVHTVFFSPLRHLRLKKTWRRMKRNFSRLLFWFATGHCLHLSCFVCICKWSEVMLVLENVLVSAWCQPWCTMWATCGIKRQYVWYAMSLPLAIASARSTINFVKLYWVDHCVMRSNNHNEWI